MPSFKYLLHFSYIGTRYRYISILIYVQFKFFIYLSLYPNISGVAEQANQANIKTVHSQIIKSLNSLEKKPLFASSFYISSRTDRGVHALHNTGNVDLEFDENQKTYKFPFNKIMHQEFCDKLSDNLNGILVKNEEAIR